MKLARYLVVALAAALTPSCFIYDPSLLDGDDSGGGGTGNSDGNGATGNTDGGGGTGNSPNGGGGSGNSPNGGGGGSGATGGGGTGSTGGTAADDTLVTDMAGGDYQYANTPFFGKWSRTAQPDAVWTAASEADMVVELSDEAGNYAFEVAASLPTNDWGVDAYLTLQDDGTSTPFDISDYTGLRFRAKTANGERSLRVALEDTVSNYTAGMCAPPTGDDSPDCNKHSNAVPGATLNADATWKTFEIPLDTFMQGSRSVPIDLTEVYSIHFTMDPTAAAATTDFFIDDIYFYTE